jgi:hypothetical protein
MKSTASCWNRSRLVLEKERPRKGTQHLDEVKRVYPLFHIARDQALCFGGQPESIRRVAGAAPARQGHP